MTIQQKAIQLCQAQDAEGIFKFLDNISKLDRDVTHLPLMVDAKK